jgi:uncharacterized protein
LLKVLSLSKGGFAPMPQRPLLTAAWRNLIFLNFPVPTDLIATLAPPGTEPDLHNGKSYISIVGFRFENVRLFGVPFPGHTNFPEINLRYYVRRRTIAGEVLSPSKGELHRGVVFVREIVPRRAVAVLANHLYNENYVTRRMRSDIQMKSNELTPGDTIEYAWRTKIPLPFREACGELRRTGLGEGSSARTQRHHWNHLAAQVAAPLALPHPGSLEQFITEHYWGYSLTRNGQTREYHVAHNPWRTASAENITWNCDIAANYNPPLAEFLTSQPASAIIAEGSPIQLFRGAKCAN